MDEATFTARVAIDDRPYEFLIDTWADGCAAISWRRPGESWSFATKLTRCEGEEAAS